MAILPILKYPDPALRQVSQDVTVFDDELAQLAADMLETMADAHGVGLAAPQVGKNIKLVLVDVSGEDEEHGTSVLTLVNPKIVQHGGSMVFEEGCLSVIDLKANVTRAKTVKIVAQDIKGQPLTLDLEGYRSVVAQHELDHLSGILFIDHLSNLKRELYIKRLKKLQKAQEEEEEEEKEKRQEEPKSRIALKIGKI
ncbi:MAG: peptide deformylase [Deltaproteobacteria bacterium]|jgi:peptide deformylase|nr:peptide deformylase [Deltaproteobacteria bacterium]